MNFGNYGDLESVEVKIGDRLARVIDINAIRRGIRPTLRQDKQGQFVLYLPVTIGEGFLEFVSGVGGYDMQPLTSGHPNKWERWFDYLTPGQEVSLEKILEFRAELP